MHCRYPGDRLWELLWQTVTVGPYARPWSVVGFPLGVSSEPGSEKIPSGFLILVGPDGWYSGATDALIAHCFSFVHSFRFAIKAIQTASHFATLSDRTSSQRTEEMATAGKLHGVLAPLQRLEFRITLAAHYVRASRPHKDILAGFEALRTQVFEAKRCVKDFLDTRMLSVHNQAGRESIPESQYTDLEKVIASAMKDLQELAGQKGKVFVFRPTHVARLPITKTDLELIIANLLHNAIKYGDPGTKIKITSEQRDSSAIVDFTSYGICIRPAERERIFEPGYRTAEASRIEFTAAGLGLFAARRAAERWGGHLFLCSSDRDEDEPARERCRNTFRLELRC